MQRRPSANVATLWLIAASTALRWYFASGVGLGIGESYYFGAARHLSLSYFDQPPVAATMAGLSLRLFGVSNGLVLRLPFLLLFSATTWLAFLVGRRLFGPWQGFWAAVLVNIAPVFLLSTGVFFQPEGPLMFFWLAAIYVLAPLLTGDATQDRATRQWIVPGVMLGLAMLSKYSALFLVVGSGLFLLGNRDRRRWLIKPGPYLALGVALLCLAPVFLWNAQHAWVSFLWQGSRGTRYQGIHFDWLVHNVSGQAIELLPWIWLPLLFEPWRAFTAPAGERTARRLLLCIGLPPIIAFTIVASYANVGDHFHWGTPGYLALLIGLGATVNGWVVRGGGLVRSAIGFVVALSIAFMIMVNRQAVTGEFNHGYGGLSTWLASGNDATVEMIDFNDLETAFQGLGLLERKDVFVFSDRWFLAGKVDYALKGRYPFFDFDPVDPREYAFFDSSERMVGKEGILVTRRKDLRELRADYGEYCSSLDALGPVLIHRLGVVEDTVYLYRCESLVQPFPTPYR